jgi:hypothetical protein
VQRQFPGRNSLGRGLFSLIAIVFIGPVLIQEESGIYLEKPSVFDTQIGSTLRTWNHRRFKDDVHSVLHISSAHNKGGPPDIKHCPNFASFELFWIETYSLYSFTSIANQKSVRYSVSISYFTIIAVQNINQVRACAQEWTSSLRELDADTIDLIVYVFVIGWLGKKTILERWTDHIFQNQLRQKHRFDEVYNMSASKLRWNFNQTTCMLMVSVRL